MSKTPKAKTGARHVAEMAKCARLDAVAHVRASNGKKKSVSRCSTNQDGVQGREEGTNAAEDEEVGKDGGPGANDGPRERTMATFGNRTRSNKIRRMTMQRKARTAASRAARLEPKRSEQLEETSAMEVDDGTEQVCVLSKPIFVLSDCTGESAANTCRAALGQFEVCRDLSCPTNLAIYRFLAEEREVFEIVRKAAEQDALVVYTLVEKRMKQAVETACNLYKVKSVDMWSNLLEEMEVHLEKQRIGVPLGRRSTSSQGLGPDYFRMIEAVEFTRKQDDGALPENWKDADILLIGVSRTGKTPLSIYLGQRGLKVANLPLVPGVPVPKQLYEIDQNKVFALLVDPNVLHSIRTNRLSNLGLGPNESYDDLRKIREELAEAKRLYAQNPAWPVIDVTNTGVEESAARIMRIISERQDPEHTTPHMYHLSQSVEP